MTKVPIAYVFGVFYDNGKRHKIVGESHGKFIAKDLTDPKLKRVQFHKYTVVEIDDDDAPAVLFLMEETLRRTRVQIVDLEEAIKMLKDQGVTEGF